MDFLSYIKTWLECFIKHKNSESYINENHLQCYIVNRILSDEKFKKWTLCINKKITGIYQIKAGQNKDVQWDSDQHSQYYISPDLSFDNENGCQKILVELKVIRPDELGNNSNCYPFIYSSGINIDDDLLCYNYLKGSNYPKRNNDTETKAIFAVDSKKYLTYFQEGQIWADIVRLLSIKEQSPDYACSELYLVGIIKNPNKGNTTKQFSDENSVKDKLETIIKYLQEQTNIKVFAGFDQKKVKGRVWAYYLKSPIRSQIIIHVIWDHKFPNWIGYLLNLNE